MRSDNPVPRRSNKITLLNAANRSMKGPNGGRSQFASTLVAHHGMKTKSSDPLPTTWYSDMDTILGLGVSGRSGTDGHDRFARYPFEITGRSVDREVELLRGHAPEASTEDRIRALYVPD